MMVTLIRVMLGSLFAGTFLGPAFFLSLGGGLAGTLAMGLIYSAAPVLFSALGLSIIGALFHNIAQLSVAYFLFIQKIEPMLLITPIIILLGTLTGAVNGIVSDLLIRNLKKSMEKIQNVNY
jgi:heptaprenyl diphosphate synthase